MKSAQNPAQMTALVVMCALLAGGGCGSPPKTDKQVDYIPLLDDIKFPVKYEISPDFHVKAPRTVAVLPFSGKVTEQSEENIVEVSREDEVDAIRMLREVFYNTFANLGYQDVAPDIVDYLLEQNGITTIAQITDTDVATIGKILDVDAVIYGDITSVSNFTGGIYSETVIRGKLRMIDTGNNETLWKAKFSEGSRGGLIFNSAQLVDIIKSQFVNAQKSLAFLKVAEEFSRKVVMTIPDPITENRDIIPMPKITSIDVKIPEGRGVLLVHDFIEVIMEGTAGGSATFHIGNYLTDIPMAEEAPGTYRGGYQVTYGDVVSQVPVAVTLKGDAGRIAMKFYEDAKIKLSMDALPPPAPEDAQLHLENENQVKLSWNTNPKEIITSEISGYSIYRSSDRIQFFLVASVTEPAYTDTLPVSLERDVWYYQVVAFDEYANQSQPSQILSTKGEPHNVSQAP